MLGEHGFTRGGHSRQEALPWPPLGGVKGQSMSREWWEVPGPSPAQLLPIPGAGRLGQALGGFEIGKIRQAGGLRGVQSNQDFCRGIPARKPPDTGGWG